MKGILRQFNVAKTPQQNEVAKWRNMTLIKAARTMLADSKLLTTFWAEAVNTACYVQNRVLVVKPHNKTPYELFHGRTSTLSYMRPFGYHVSILKTIDHLSKFDSKADKSFFVGYSLNSKAFRVFNSKTRIVEENLHIRLSKSTPNIVGSGPDWLFDIDALTRTMNYEPIVADPKSSYDDGSKPLNDDGKKVDEDPRKENKRNDQEKEDDVNNTNNVNTVSTTVNIAGTNRVNAVGENISIKLQFDPNMPALEDVSKFDFSSDDEDDGVVVDMNNLDTTIQNSSWIEAMQKELLLLGIKCFKAFPLLVMKIPLLKYFAIVSAKEFPLLSCSVTPAEEFALLDKDKDYSQSKTHYSQSKTYKFRIQQYLQNEHYTLWEVIEFGDSYKSPQEETGKGPASESFAKKKGKTVVITIKDMQKRRNDVKARTTLLLALLDEHQLRFSKNRDDLDTMCLDNVYNHLKVYEPEVQMKSDSNSQNMAFISSSNTSSGKGKVHTVSTQVSTASTDVAAASISHDTVCAYIASQSNGSLIKYKDITQIDEDDIEEIDIKWNMALLSMRADMFCHFARECRAPKSQDRGRRESYKQGLKEEEQAPKALMAIDGIGWD
uniref:Ribonuclease H-like domain-containing protein n=1 Tax=Tanacetum cinerariifolium TaxID=118510 RepID=A0A699HX28_TANCI|nr:ribonuclease H-like domain-containing protein [Tanacetum cinerariifolium]